MNSCSSSLTPSSLKPENNDRIILKNMVFPLKYQLPNLLIGGGAFGVVNLFNIKTPLKK